MTHPRRALFALLVLSLTASSAFGFTTDQREKRAELDQFMSELARIDSFGLQEAEAHAAVATMSDENVTALHQGLDRFGPWQELPVIAAGLDQNRRAFERERLARELSESGLPFDEARRLENFRSDFLFFIDQLSLFASLLPDEHQRDLSRVRSGIERMPPEAVAVLEQEFLSRHLELQLALTGQGFEKHSHGEGLHAGSGIPSLQHIPSCDDDCGIDVVCWVDAVACYISAVGHVAGHAAALASDIATFVGTFFTTTIPNLVSDIAKIATDVSNFFVGVFNDVASFVTTQFNAIVNLLPTSVNDVLAHLGIDWNNVNWNTIAGAIPTITPPCPQEAVEVAANICDRGGDALTGLLFDLAPSDGVSWAFKVAVAVVHYPLSYLCQCNDIAAAIAFADAQEAHRALTAQHLDLKLSTRATQVSVDALTVSLADLDGDVAKVEAKIDAIESTVDKTESTTDRMHVKVDDLTLGNLDQQEFLSDFDTLMKRIHIENNALQNKPDAISLFQLPSVFGGMLETVATVVADTIQMHVAAGQFTFQASRFLQQGDALSAVGDFVGAFEAYRQAYSEAVK
jgi:hypothetical protein